MPKLFVAIDLPDFVTAELVRIQPPAVNGIRLVQPDQMHLTLHFIGEFNIEPMAAALGSVKSSEFSLAIEGVGEFPSADGAVTLWAGVKKTPELLVFHEAVARALGGIGIQSEKRPYNPHVTLARCESGVARQMIDEFLNKNAGFSRRAVKVASFGLYSSALIAGAPRYRCETTWRLGAAK